MKINLDRLCKLAGVEGGKSNLLSEASNRSYHDDASVSDEADFRFGSGQLSENNRDLEEDDMPVEGMYGSDMDEDEIIEVDEKMLVQEIRRAKQMMAETRQRKESLQESKLRKMISEEIDSVFKDLNLTSGWVYGKKKPTNRHKGSVNTAFPGIGFKNNR